MMDGGPVNQLKRHDLRFTMPIERWDEALPLGNGMTGCLVWGDGAPLRFSLDRADLWDLRPAPETLAPDFTYAGLIDCVRRGDQEAIVKRFDAFYETYPYPTKLPAGRLELAWPRRADRVEGRLRLTDATASVKLTFGPSVCRVDSYVHAVDGLGYIRIRGLAEEWTGDTQLRIVAPDYAGVGRPDEDGQEALEMGQYGSLTLLGYPGAEAYEDGDVRWIHQRTCTELEYAIIVAARRRTPGSWEVVYIVASSLDGGDWLEAAKRRALTALDNGFANAHVGHSAWWSRYWSRSGVVLPDREAEGAWYVNNYLFGSCSRKGCPPMPLQGVWTADEGALPPWKGDYHHDLNTQLSYWHYLKANHLEEGESFLDFLWSLRPQASAFARTFYDAPGINLPSVMAINGVPMGGWAMYSLSITNQIWLCQAFDHYWLYTGDETFLREKAYVYFKETAACVLRWLEEDEAGQLQLPVSSSPEIHNNSLRAWMSPNSNYDLALLLYLFRRLKDMAERIGADEEARQWSNVLGRLPPLAVDGRGVLLVAPGEALAESHRHHSNMMAVYPLKLLDYEKLAQDRAVIDATVEHMEKLGRGWWVGYSYGWAASFYALMGNGRAALYHLQQLWQHMTSPNGFHLNGDFRHTGMSVFHYRPFTLEGNFAGINALQEMLLQTDGGIVRVFPAIPEEWRDEIGFRGFRGEMGIVVDADIRDGRLQHVTLHAERAGTFAVRNDFDEEELAMFAGDEVIVDETIVCDRGGLLRFAMQAGETRTLRPART